MQLRQPNLGDLDTGVRCVKCKTEFATLHTPVAEFNHAVTEELEEALEE